MIKSDQNGIERLGEGVDIPSIDAMIKSDQNGIERTVIGRCGGCASRIKSDQNGIESSLNTPFPLLDNSLDKIRPKWD